MVWPIPENLLGEGYVVGLHKLVKTREGRVALWLPEEERLYSFETGELLKRRCRIETGGGWTGNALRVSLVEGDGVVWAQYESGNPIVGAEFMGEDGFGNAWVQVEEALPSAEKVLKVRIWALR